jgi:hypothetical protein
MRIACLTVLATLAALSLPLVPPCGAQTTTAASRPAALYQPAAGTDHARVRVDTGVHRGPGQANLPLVSVVAPDHIGTTISDQPQLYWYLSDDTKLPVEVSLYEVGTEDKLYEFSTAGSAAGFHCLDLAKENVRLDLNKQYQFTVNVVVNPKDHASDRTTSGYIKRIKPPAALPAGKDSFAALLGSGIWYDGVADLMKQLEAKKGDADLTAARDSLLRQVGLQEIAGKPLTGAVHTYP